MTAGGPEQRLELVYRQRPTPDGPHPGERLATSKRHERETLDSSARDSTPGTPGLKQAVELELSHENARPLAHLFESLQVQRLVVGELDDSDAWSELRGRGSRNGRLPGPGSAQNDGQPSPTNCPDQPANEARTGKVCHCLSAPHRARASAVAWCLKRRRGQAMMNEDTFNREVRKFLKQVGVTSQREIERAVRRSAEAGQLTGNEKLKATARVQIEGIGLDHLVEVDIALS